MAALALAAAPVMSDSQSGVVSAASFCSSAVKLPSYRSACPACKPLPSSNPWGPSVMRTQGRSIRNTVGAIKRGIC